MLKFQHPEYLYLALLVLPMVLIYLWYRSWRSGALEAIANPAILERLSPARSNAALNGRFILLALAWILISVGLANPQVGTKLEKVKRKGVDVIIALDVSKSMLAEDVSPNRLMRAKQFVSSLISELRNDRIGLIVFAGHAYLQMPLTVDYTAGKMYLKTVNTDLVPTQGTAIGDAVRLAMESFETEESKHKALIVITDGENHEDDAVEAIEEAVETGMIVHTIGLGTSKGAPIPDRASYGRNDFKRDKDGSIVLSKLNEEMLQDMARKGNGEYWRLASSKDLAVEIRQLLAGMESKEFEERVFTDYEDQFGIFLGAAFFLLLIRFIWPERRLKTWFNKNEELG